MPKSMQHSFSCRCCRWLNWSLAALSSAVLLTWIVILFAVDGGALPRVGISNYFLSAQLSVLKAGFYGFVVAFASALILFPGFRSRNRIYGAFVDAGQMAANIIVIVTAIGLIVGLIQISGFSGKLSLLLTQLANGPLPVALVVR